MRQKKEKPIPEGNFEMYAKTFFGLEDVLAKELVQLGAMRVTPRKRMVSFYGDKGFMYKANLSLRTALRILVPIQRDNVRNENQLYKSVSNIAWEKYLQPNETLTVDAVVNSSYFNHSHYVALKTKDAIVDRMRERTGSRPSVDRLHPTLRVNVHIHEDSLTISIDSSGDSLHKRGYRSDTNLAPINEVLAAGLVMHTHWEGSTHLLDPMCGSGTLLIEAAMLACNIPANINRKEFAFEKFPDFEPELFEMIHNGLLKRIKEHSLKIVGYDKAPSAVRKARENVKNANLEDFITIEQKNFYFSEKESGPWTLLFNPPYGERLQADIPEMYAKIGDTLKSKYQNCTAWFITAALDGLKHVGLRASRKIPIMNGKLDSRLVKYELYSGSKKAKYQK